MTASEARQAAMKEVQSEIDCIKLKIEQSCKRGNRNVGLRMPGRKWWQDKSPSDAAIMFFEQNGYRYCGRNNTLFW
jgi:hypothetical protein